MAKPDIEGFTLLATGLLFIFIRIYVRLGQVGSPLNFAVDDYLMPLAGVFFACETILAHLVRSNFDGLTNSYMTDEQRAAVDPASREHYNRVWGSKIQVTGWSMYAMIMWLIKFCVAIYYSRLTRSTLNVLIMVIPNVLTDLYLMSIPLPLLWGVKISPRQKLTLMGLFSSAAFIIMAAIIRAVLVLMAGPNGAITGSEWACRETFVSVIVSNLPIIQPLIRKGAGRIGLGGFGSDEEGEEGRGSLVGVGVGEIKVMKETIVRREFVGRDGEGVRNGGYEWEAGESKSNARE
ncbi:hypothetical protein BO94DRAFT_559431 [Aspergillus sclerotioniger CBS 115572]|uniref:Rhodopsin domain-containing protein n=1 Tax=Aspergillus sclerotioniger CBS 115572 TaxID=1450535 RepID=A0A317VTA9_9EURO|nr:hypothetical protein BO94DRAFT_559431 [Aspergillus sclerotioniger CBS 115572]PWY76078.1 hypothetical protein BO94DRAFT_559431 [Aspergillus sclerotioniger CBS 115572]